MKRIDLNVDKQTKVDFSKLAKKLECSYKREDLIVSDSLNKTIDDLISDVNRLDPLYEDRGIDKKLKLGYKILFYGPPGTGKTLTAKLIGKYTSRDVYRIDLSMIVSKYIGETEKNLSLLFDRAENKDWILFFDDADAFFGKRTEIKDSHDRYANQEIAYLLQRIENYDGLVILASNFKTNIDDAFLRRFNSIIHFPMPSSQERKKIWQKYFPQYTGEEKVLKQIPELNKIQLTGGEIKESLDKAELIAKHEKESIQLTHLKISIDDITTKKLDDN